VLNDPDGRLVAGTSSTLLSTGSISNDGRRCRAPETPLAAEVDVVVDSGLGEEVSPSVPSLLLVEPLRSDNPHEVDERDEPDPRRTRSSKIGFRVVVLLLFLLLLTCACGWGTVPICLGIDPPRYCWLRIEIWYSIRED
jgi:hypothetical protein